MTTRAKPPRLSVNKLGEYMTARAGRQNKILYDAKHPQDFITPFYRDAAEAIATAIVGGLEDISSLERAARTLGDRNPTKVSDMRRFAGNIDAIEVFMNMVGDVDMKGVEPRLGSHQANYLTIHGVDISVRPEVTLHLKKRNGEPLVGGVKLHFPKTFPLNADAADYISACIQLYARDHLSSFGAPSHAHCYVIDMASGRVFPGAKAIKSRIRDVEETCKQIATIWPSI